MLPDWLTHGYLRLIDPVSDWLVRRKVHPNTITVIGTLCTVAGGVIYGFGHIRTGGLFLGLIGSYLTSYTRARAEALGIDAKLGILQRPERVVLLSAPQGLFGLALNGWVLASIIVVLTVTAWITVYQRVAFVYRATAQIDAKVRTIAERPWLRRRRKKAASLLKGD
jgi:phosphatidylglycerophosphate synthase